MSLAILTGCSGPVRSSPFSNAIKGYEPAWMPDEDQLAGAVVILDSAQAEDETREQRQRCACNLRAAMHLYHLIQRAGGRAILTHVDETIVPADEHDAATTLQRDYDPGHADLIIGIDYGKPTAESPSREDTLSVELADAMKTVPALRSALPLSGNDSMCPGVRVYPLEPPARSSCPTDETCYRPIARGIFDVILAFCRAHDVELAKRRKARGTDSELDAIESIFLDARTHRRHKLERLAQSIWPEGDLPVEKAAWFAELLRRVALSDLTAVYFEPVVTVEGDTVVIGGATSSAMLLGFLPGALRAAGVEQVRYEMRLLPDEAKLGTAMFGACRATSAMTFGRPRESVRPQTQLLFGEPVFVLDRDGDFLLVQAGDGYWGWVRDKGIRLMGREGFTRYTSARQAVLLVDVQYAGVTIPRGARLPIRSTGWVKYALMTPDGATLDVASSNVSIKDPDELLERRAKGALEYLGTPYLLGGRSPVALDCSGLVTNLYERDGLPVARDAAQQFISGRLVATHWYRDDIRTGDRLYFINETGKIFHTGIALSRTHFIHASPPEVQISSLIPGDRLYEERWDQTFLGAKRP